MDPRYRNLPPMPDFERNADLGIDTAPLEALGRLCAIALQNTGQSRRAADFLLAWHNAAENGAWDPVDLWAVDEEIAQDMLVVLRLALRSRRYPGDLGFGPEIDRIWRAWRHPLRPAARQREG